MKDESGRAIVNERSPSSVGVINAFLDHLGEAEAQMVMEATGFYEFIYDVIEDRGPKVVLAHPLKLRALTAGRAKNDKNDAEMLADGAYSTRENFDLLRRQSIVPVIRMRKNANMKRMGGTSARRLAVRERNLLGEAYWRYVKRYGRRWPIDAALSAVKRMLGDEMRSRRRDFLISEVENKFWTWNEMRRADSFN